MTDKWQLYSQVGVDGPEYGIRIRPGYVVVGFQEEDAQQIVAWQNASIRPVTDGDILERAKATCARTIPSQHWNLLPELIAKIERLRSEKPFLSEETIRPSINLVECEKTKEIWRLKEEIADKDARIKELEDLNESLIENGNDLRLRCHKAEKLNKRLEAAFLEAKYSNLFDSESYIEGEGYNSFEARLKQKARAALDELRKK